MPDTDIPLAEKRLALFRLLFVGRWGAGYVFLLPLIQLFASATVLAGMELLRFGAGPMPPTTHANMSIGILGNLLYIFYFILEPILHVFITIPEKLLYMYSDLFEQLVYIHRIQYAGSSTYAYYRPDFTPHPFLILWGLSLFLGLPALIFSVIPAPWRLWKKCLMPLGYVSVYLMQCIPFLFGMLWFLRLTAH